ncbi:hypothetical protein [Chengkuizengella axinellae]|uniref:DUF3951 domain-containing protein n=1 Tax=Chengkuizengella axinellae TaxID=3064388 RepID=A0ABT9J3X4_9BACL|nr:hypothetical protein [Chengkuizengella sp. 2205SS18-9]MDP5275685.1 hypothetical protein [Chengkuizengella sp. 2205SS18-9]
MNSRQRIVFYVILGLIVIGFLGSAFTNPKSFIIPLLVFGLVFYLYKFPPRRYRNNHNYKNVAKIQKKQQRKKRRKHKFKVIDGNKSKNDKDDKDDEEESYPFH